MLYTKTISNHAFYSLPNNIDFDWQSIQFTNLKQDRVSGQE